MISQRKKGWVGDSSAERKMSGLQSRGIRGEFLLAHWFSLCLIYTNGALGGTLHVELPGLGDKLSGPFCVLFCFFKRIFGSLNHLSKPLYSEMSYLLNKPLGVPKAGKNNPETLSFGFSPNLKKQTSISMGWK